jgi:hypothetical protein
MGDGHRIGAAAIVLLALLCNAPGCKSSSKPPSGSAARTRPATAAEMRTYAMATADTYTMIILQSLDTLAQTTKQPKVKLWAEGQCIATAYASLVNATGPNDAASLLDMMIYSSLKRAALEDHWIPDLLHEEGEALLPEYRRAEAEVWEEAGKVLKPTQLDSMRQLINDWKARNPGQYYVANVRFTDFEIVQQTKPGAPPLKIPSNILGLIYLDPLAGLDPVAAELKSYRSLTERMMFVAVRTPMLISRQVDFVLMRATFDPQVVAFVDSTTRFSDATSRFADSVASYPQQFRDSTQAAIAQALKGVTSEREAAFTSVTAERKGAIDQANAAITAQRDAIMKELDAREAKLNGIIGNVKGVVERADQAGVNINSATTQTVSATEQATQRTLNYAFRLALALILVLLLGIPLVLLLYRMATRRWLGGASCPGPDPQRSLS